MELANFPVEILTEILSSERCSVPFLSLWKCGNSQLQYKISLAATVIDLKDTRLVSASRYPKCISNLKNLRSLALDRGIWPLMATGPRLSSELSSLMLANLETLHLVCEEFISALERFDSTESTAIPIPTMHERGESTAWNLTECFPLLTTLKIDSMTAAREVPIAFVCGLPNTLTRLAVPQMRIKASSDPFMSLLPRDLQHLDTTLDVLVFPKGDESPSDLAAWRDAPPNLHTISMLQSFGARSLKSFSFLPRSLKMCKLAMDVSWSPELIATLPPGFAELILEELASEDYVTTDFDATKLLPSSLQSLAVSYIPLHQLGSLPSFYNALPRTLTSLSCPFNCVMHEWPLRDADFSPRSFWPPGLTSMDLTSYNFRAQDLKTLPTTLERIHVRWQATETFDCAQLPRGLTSLHISPAEASGNKLTLLPGLPTSLTKLSIFAQDFAADANISDLLPSSLRSLRLISRDASWYSSAIIKWPQSLTKLVLNHWNFEKMKTLPSSLRRLHLRCRLFEDDSIVPDTSKDYFADLPTGLEVFSARFGVRGEHSHCWSGSSFSKLVNLREIALLVEFEPSFLKTIAEKLPKLTSLDVLRIAFSPDYAPLLPQSLERLLIMEVDGMWASWMPYWPPAAILFAPDQSGAADLNARRKKAVENARTYPAPSLCN